MQGQTNIFATKSQKTWDEGRECIRRDHINSAANRIYYAVFQAVKGYAVHANVFGEHEAEKVHTLALNLVGTQTEGQRFRLIYNKLMTLRITADYRRDDVDRTSLEKLLLGADEIRKHFIARSTS